jgi:hypothetical protein
VGIGAAGFIVFAITRSLCALRARLVPPSDPRQYEGASPIVPYAAPDSAKSGEALEEWELVEGEKRSGVMGTHV